MAGRGRPKKYRDEFAEDVEKICSIFGADDKKLCKYFKIAESTLNNWKKDYPNFMESLKKGKEEFDKENVEKSLLERALGYEHEEIKFFSHEGIVTDERVIIKRYPPDTTAAIFYLKNRLPDRWKDVRGIDHSGKISNNLTLAQALKEITDHFKSNPELENDLLKEAEG
jgi:hypothetical protein